VVALLLILFQVSSLSIF